MVFQDSRRSVLPNGEHIDILRKKKGWTIEALALESDLGMRTVQKAIAGGPVSIATLQIIAEQLEAPYASLLLGAEGEHAGEILTLNIQIAVGPDDKQRIGAIIALLESFLPDKVGLYVLGVVGGSLLIGVKKSAANEAIFANGLLQEAMNVFGITKFSVDHEPPTEKVWFLDREHTSHYLDQVKVKYEQECHSKPWSKLREHAKRDCYIKYIPAIADVIWNNNKQDFQSLMNEIRIVICPANYVAIFKWCHDYLYDTMRTDYPRYEGTAYHERYLLIMQFVKYISFLEGLHQFRMIRDQE